MEHGEGAGVEALLISLAIAGIVVGIVLIIAALLASRYPRARGFFHPLHLLILLTQVIDGSTTWVGVDNPFGLDLPPYRETVFISALIIDVFGGAVFFLLKVMLGILVVLALIAATEAAKTPKEQAITLLVQASLVVIGAIPVWNNTMNFLALG